MHVETEHGNQKLLLIVTGYTHNFMKGGGAQPQGYTYRERRSADATAPRRRTKHTQPQREPPEGEQGTTRLGAAPPRRGKGSPSEVVAPIPLLHTIRNKNHAAHTLRPGNTRTTTGGSSTTGQQATPKPPRV